MLNSASNTTVGSPGAARLQPPPPDSFTASTTRTEKIKRVAHDALALLLLCRFTYAYWPAKMIAMVISVTAACPMILPISSVIGSLALAYTIYKIAQVAAGSIVNIASLLPNFLVGKFFGADLAEEMRDLAKKGYTIKFVTIYKGGVSYKGAAVTHRDTATNGNWTLHTVGNGEFYQARLKDRVVFDHSNGSNTLIINGPNVGGSGGWSTPAQMSNSAEAGMQYLEKAINAKKIVLFGHSLGGGILSEAILKHKFSNPERYFAVYHMTFNNLPDIVPYFISIPYAGTLLRALGHVMDNVNGVEKLKKLGIKYIVVRGGINRPVRDPVIPHDFSLARHVIDVRATEIFESALGHKVGISPHLNDSSNNKLIDQIKGHFQS